MFLSLNWPLCPRSSCLLQTPFCLKIPASALWMMSLTVPPGGLTGRSTKSKKIHSGWVKIKWIKEMIACNSGGEKKLKFYLIGATKRDGWSCGQASGHAEIWTGQSKLYSKYFTTFQSIWPSQYHLTPPASALVCSCGVTSRRQSWGVESSTATDWRRGCHCWLLDTERKDHVSFFFFFWYIKCLLKSLI